MLDRDLASIYHVMTGRLNEAVKRNLARFPPEFMFQLSDLEMKELIANCDRFKMMKHSPSRMYAFTEQGVAMLSAVLKKEFMMADKLEKRFYLYVVTNFSAEPVPRIIENPLNSGITFECKTSKIEQKVWTANLLAVA